MNIHIIVDWKKNKQFFLEKEFKKNNISLYVYDIPNYNIKDRIKKFRIILLYLKYVKVAYRTLKHSKKNEIIICWNFTTSIALGYLCKLFRKKRTILALNIIAHKKGRVSEFLRRIIFSPVMNLNNYFITVNSSAYINDYAVRFKIPQSKFFILNDPIQTQESLNFNYSQNYVFAGGEAQRDWETLFKAAKFTPEINYVCIAREKYFNHKLIIPSNIKLLFDVNNYTFYEYMQKSSIVVIPLKSTLPSGLIILLKAALYNKPIIATETPSTKNYIINEKSGFLFKKGDYKALADSISKLFYNKNLQKSFTTNLYNYILDNYSQKKYAERLLKIIKLIN